MSFSSHLDPTGSAVTPRFRREAGLAIYGTVTPMLQRCPASRPRGGCSDARLPGRCRRSSASTRRRERPGIPATPLRRRQVFDDMRPPTGCQLLVFVNQSGDGRFGVDWPSVKRGLNDRIDNAQDLW